MMWSTNPEGYDSSVTDTENCGAADFAKHVESKEDGVDECSREGCTSPFDGEGVTMAVPAKRESSLNDEI